MMCNGATWDEVLFDMHAKIERYGWSIEYVMGDKKHRPWGYTVGLSDRFDHPELVLVGAGMERTGTFLNSIATAISEGEPFRAGEVILGRKGEHNHLVDIHRDHFDNGTLNMWMNYYEALGRMPQQRAIEIVPPGRRPRLDRKPFQGLGGD